MLCDSGQLILSSLLIIQVSLNVPINPVQWKDEKIGTSCLSV